MAKIARGAKKPQHSPDVDPRFAQVAKAFAKDPRVTLEGTEELWSDLAREAKRFVGSKT